MRANDHKPVAQRLPRSPVNLATRLVVVTSGTVLLASSLAGATLLRMEQQQLVADELTEARVLARSLQVSVEHALRDGQDPDIAELLDRLELIAAHVDVIVFSRDSEEPRLVSAGSDVSDSLVNQVKELTGDQDEVVRMYHQPTGPPRLVAGVPLHTKVGERIGTLIITRPLLELQQDIQSTTRLTAFSVALFALSTTIVMLALLRREISDPLAGIVAAVSKLGDDLDTVLDLPEQRSDELHIVADTFVRLQRQMIAARDAAAAETQQREALERQLRDADKLIAVGQLATGIAHEIGSPLQVLIGRARLLAQDAEHSDEVRRQATLIEEHASRIATIVDQLQDVSRRRPPRILTIDLREPVTKVMWLLEPEAERRQVDLTWTVPAQPCPVRADPDEVQQVVLNLALNALQATQPGNSVVVQVIPTESGGALRVVDQGCGMDAQTSARVFEPFFTTRADQGGTGLGLAVVKSIVDRHRARVRIDSTPGHGATVEVTWQGEST